MSLRLTVVTGSLAGKQRELGEGSLLLGRSSGSALQFDRALDGMVSGRHAVIARGPDGYTIDDRGSTNGTLVNGAQVTHALLKDGDLVQLGGGGPQLHVAIGEEDAVEPTVSLAGDASPPAASLPQPQASPHPPPPPPPPRGIAPAGATSARPAMPSASTAARARERITGIGFYDPDRDRTRAGMHEGPGLIGALIALAIGGMMGLVILGIAMAELGIGGSIMGGLMAFTPAPFYLALFLWLDRFDPEPAWALGGAFAWGASFALLISYLANTAFGVATSVIAGAPAGDALSAIISAPFVEELTKGLGVILILVFLRREFDGVLDGIVYASIVALGFATVENVFYYGRKWDEEGFGGMLVLAFLRGGLAPFSHSLFTSMTGIGCGISRESHRPAVRWLAPAAGLIAAMTLHGLWNLVASLLGGLWFLVYFFVWVPLFALFLVLMIVMAVRERRIVRKMLELEVAKGFLAKDQVILASSLTRRLTWVFSSLGSPARLQARRRYLKLLTKLAFCYWHVERASASAHETISLPKIPLIKAEMRTLAARIA